MPPLVFAFVPPTLGAIGALILGYGLIKKTTKAVVVGFTFQAVGVGILALAVWQIVTWTP